MSLCGSISRADTVGRSAIQSYADFKGKVGLHSRRRRQLFLGAGRMGSAKGRSMSNTWPKNPPSKYMFGAKLLRPLKNAPSINNLEVNRNVRRNPEPDMGYVSYSG